MAWYKAGSVVSPLRGFCMGMLPVNVCAISNVEVNGYISGEYVKNGLVLTCLSGRRCWRGAIV